jgi:hypothetical protein
MSIPNVDQLDEWFIGTNLSGSRRYLVHTQEPRFLAEVIDDTDGNGIYHGFTFSMPNTTLSVKQECVPARS